MAGIIHYEASWLTAQHSCASVSKILNPVRRSDPAGGHVAGMSV